MKAALAWWKEKVPEGQVHSISVGLGASQPDFQMEPPGSHRALGAMAAEVLGVG